MHATSENHIDIDIEERAGGIRIARASGELDMLSAPALWNCYENRISTRHNFVLDFEQVTFLASAGMQTLIDIDFSAHRHNQAWALVANSRPVTRPLQITGLLDRLPMQPSVTTALKVLVGESATGSGEGMAALNA
jgi:anti-sigma B factor antagonist